MVDDRGLMMQHRDIYHEEPKELRDEHPIIRYDVPDQKSYNDVFDQQMSMKAD